jgi:tetraacyldisaccharide 4'-kinase
MMRAPPFWYGASGRDAAPLLQALLAPISVLYGAAARWTQARAISAKLDAPVICVGNVTVGGVGKTPIVRALRARLSARGWRPATLSRGHGGRLAGPLVVDPSVHGASDVGDEPLLHARDGLAIVARDRLVGAELAIDRGADLILMDDGFQNTALVKDVSLLVFDAKSGIGNGKIFPAGPLRERLKDGLARADAAIVMGGDGPAPDYLGGIAGPVLFARLDAAAPAPDGPLVAFAGIGDPVKFFDTLAGLGADLVETAPYPDHHPYKDEELRWLATLAQERGARLITTEKDAMRLSPLWRGKVLTLPVMARFADEAALDALFAAGLPATVPTGGAD